jgi:hypothetical protein
MLASGLEDKAMSTRSDSVLPPLVIERRAARAQVRETPAAVPPPRERMMRKRTQSWDPYEVWRTRVKSPTSPE